MAVPAAAACCCRCGPVVKPAGTGCGLAAAAARLPRSRAWPPAPPGQAALLPSPAERRASPPPCLPSLSAGTAGHLAAGAPGTHLSSSPPAGAPPRSAPLRSCALLLACGVPPGPGRSTDTNQGRHIHPCIFLGGGRASGGDGWRGEAAGRRAAADRARGTPRGAGGVPVRRPARPRALRLAPRSDGAATQRRDFDCDSRARVPSRAPRAG